MDDKLKSLLIGATILDIELDGATALTIITSVGELSISIGHKPPNRDQPFLDIELFNEKDT